MSAAAVIDRLETLGKRPRRSGAGWTALCPAHDDNAPSLTIAEGDSADVVLHCHAGCPFEDIRAAIGPDVFSMPAKDEERRLVATYRYVDEHGTLLAEKLRYDPKDFRWRQPGDSGWQWHRRGVRKVLYRLDEVTQAVEAGEYVYVVEGEKDADRLAKEGLVATCNPDGAGKWHHADDHARATLAQAARVIVIRDRDEPGTAHARDIVSDLRARGCVDVMLVEAVEGKDVTDHLAAGRTVEELVIIDDEMEPVGSTEGDVTTWEPIDLTAVLAGVEPERPTLLTRGDGPALLYPGRVHSFFGEPESLKSWLALVACAQVLNADGTVVFVDFEDNEQGVVARLRALAVPADIIGRRFLYLRPERPIEIAATQIDELLDERQPELVIVDGVTEGMTLHGLDPLSNVDYARFHASLPKRLKRTGAAVVVIDHVVKDRDNRGRFPLGGQHKVAALDGAGYSIEAFAPFGEGLTGKARISVAKDRLGGVRKHAAGGRIAGLLTLTSYPDGGITAHLEHVDELNPDKPFRPTVLMERISRAIELQPGLTLRALFAATKGDDKAKRLAVEILIAEGYVAVEAGGRNSILHRSIRPYRGDDLDPQEVA